MNALRLLPRRKPKVFVCYRRDDSGGYAGRIYADLVKRFGKKRVFIDIDAIEGGDDFAEVTERFVSSCDVFIGVIGKRWLTISDGETRRLEQPDDFVRLEIVSALNRRIPVIPVLVQGATSPDQQELPTALRALARRQAVEISDTRWEFDVKRLISRIEEVLPSQPIAWQKLGVVVSGLSLLILGFVVGYSSYDSHRLEPAGKSPEPKATPFTEPKTTLHPEPSTTPLPGPKATPLPEPSALKRDPFPIELSVSEYQKTAVCVAQGTRVQITAEGTISLGPNIRSTGPNGKTTFTGPLGLEFRIDERYYKDTSFPLGALMCKLDSERRWQKCGEQKDFVAAAPGCIEFEINDELKKDNHGAYSVKIDVAR